MFPHTMRAVLMQPVSMRVQMRRPLGEIHHGDVDPLRTRRCLGPQPRS